MEAARPTATLDELLVKARSLLIGGLAIGLVGEARLTQDVDLILAFPVRKLRTLATRARAMGFALADASLGAAKTTGALRLRWRGLHVDLILASTTFEQRAFARCAVVTLVSRLPPPRKRGGIR